MQLIGRQIAKRTVATLLGAGVLTVASLGVAGAVTAGGGPARTVSVSADGTPAPAQAQTQVQAPAPAATPTPANESWN